MRPSRLTSIPLVAFTALLLAPAPDAAGSILGSADSFTLLGGSAISSTATVGTLISNGDVGLSPTGEAAITGFPPAVIVNGVIVPTGATTAQARADLVVAMSGLAGMTPDTDLTGQDLGGLILHPGVYHFTSTAALTGALVLDADGDNHAFWVFQIGTTFTSAANASVSVIHFGPDGGAGLGLFWNAGTEISIGADNVVEGNYLTATSIIFGANTSGGARALALASISLDNNQLDAFGGYAGGDWTGGLGYDLGGDVVPIPEPSSVLWLTPLASLAFALWRRSDRAGLPVANGK